MGFKIVGAHGTHKRLEAEGFVRKDYWQEDNLSQKSAVTIDMDLKKGLPPADG